MVVRRFLAAVSLVASAVFLVGALPVWAQSVCDQVSQFPLREETGQRRLAVWISDGWRLFPPNGTASRYALEIEGLDGGLCLAWEAPPYRQRRRQIAYISSRRMDGQELSLFRNSAAAGVPFFEKLTGSWRSSAGSDSESFRIFHRDRSRAIDGALRDLLSRWHDTSVWLPNATSYDVVSAAVADPAPLPNGAERLLMLQGRRPQASWVPFETHVPSAGSDLRIAVAYSGDLDGPGLRVYQYLFVARR